MRDEAGEGGDRDFGFWRDEDITCVGIGMLTRSLTFKNIDHSRGQKELFYIAVSSFRHSR